MLKQLELINKVRMMCESDRNVVSAFMYGSFAKGKGDKYSDIEFVIYFTEKNLESFEEKIWLNRIAPVLLTYKNEFGITEVIFDGLIRGEFHFEPLSKMHEVSTWRTTDWFSSLESTLIVDKTGELTSQLNHLIGEVPQNEFKSQAQFVVDCYAGWLIFGLNVLRRGEFARALCLLWSIQWKLLFMIRLVEGSFENWNTPSRELEKDIASSFYKEYTYCTSNISPVSLEKAYMHSWDFGKKLVSTLKSQYNVEFPSELVNQLDQYIQR